MTKPTAAPRTLRDRLWRLTYDAGWNRQNDSLRSRINQVLAVHAPWWDWGHYVMPLIGRDDCGNPSTPRGRDLWYVRLVDLERLDRSWFDGQQNKLGFVTTTTYDLVRQHPDAGWKIFDLQDDGSTLLLGYWPTPGGDGRIRPASIAGAELSLFWRWYWIDHKLKAQWLGLRPWIYYKALHAAVERKKPFSCQQVPDPKSGGYRHWHCQLKKRHAGDHRYVNYVWPGLAGVVRYEPKDAAA